MNFVCFSGRRQLTGGAQSELASNYLEDVQEEASEGVRIEGLQLLRKQGVSLKLPFYSPPIQPLRVLALATPQLVA